VTKVHPAGTAVPLPIALYSLRMQRHLRQVDVAEQADLSVNTIYLLERGYTRFPSRRTLEKLAPVFDMSVTQLQQALGLHPQATIGGRSTPSVGMHQAGTRADRDVGWSAQTERIAALFQALSASQRAYVEGVCLLLHAQRYAAAECPDADATIAGLAAQLDAARHGAD
jgi:transcriptional regulator with XRE-family HTH domain